MPSCQPRQADTDRCRSVRTQTLGTRDDPNSVDERAATSHRVGATRVLRLDADEERKGAIDEIRPSDDLPRINDDVVAGFLRTRDDSG